MPNSANMEGLLASLANGSSFPGSSRLGLMFATQRPVPVERSRRRNATAMGVTINGTSMNLEDEDDVSLLGFMHAILRSQREGHRGDVPVELHARNPFSGFNRASSVSATMTLRSHASNENDASAGRALDNPLEIEDSDDEVEVVHIS